ncbi:hypothetical protein [Nocardioides pyridinolyticus]
MLENTSDRHYSRWAAALDRLELDVSLAERRLTDSDAPDPEPWSEPDLRGPIPEDLRPRARAVLARQQEVREQVAAAASSVRRQLDFTARVDRAVTPPARPVYLDVDA